MVLPPVTPSPNQLPLNDPNWSWERFEAFCLDLISQFAEVKNCHRYGKQGDFQRGIDIFADLDNGERWVFQCKRYKNYTKAQTQKAIHKATYTANQYILLLSCEATSKVRDEVDKHPNWDVWDVEDISLKVRELPPDVARRLVETHFSPEWRRAFLGLAGLITFVSSADFFRELLNHKNRFNHTWSLVGRTELTEKLHEFVESNEQRLFILTGRGGIGKTKLLHAFSEEFDNRHQNVVLRFSAAPITPESLDELPIEPCVIVVDDANQQEGLEFLLAFARQHSQRIKLLLSCRPQSINQLRSVFEKTRFDCGEIKPSIELDNLKLEEVKQLARQALGNEYVHFAEKLAAVTRDCPLFTVIGGRLLAEKQVDPQLLERDKDFQDYLLTKFRDILIGQVSNEIEPDLCKRLLELIAAVAPIRLTNEKFKQVAAEFLKIEPSKFVSSRGILEQSGILLRRGYTLRITPDILSDHILYKRCLTPQGEPTGYVQEIFEKFKSICPAEVLRNLAELDWRIRNVSGEETDLLADIWHSIWEEFRKASNFDRCQLLDLLEEVAYHQPDRTLELVEFVMRNPATTPEDETLARIYRYTHDNVLSNLPELLRRISYTVKYLPYCCNLLWELRKHGIGTLIDLAGYDIGKPLNFNRTVLEAVPKWLKSSNEPDDICLLLDVLDSLLAKSGYSAYAESHQFVFHPFGVSRENKNIQAIRAQALPLVIDCLTSEQLKISLRAVESLEKLLLPPFSWFGLELSDEDRKQWVPEQLRVLEIIRRLTAQTENPLIHLKVIEALQGCACCYHSPEVVKQKAKTIITSIPKSHKLLLTGALRNSWNWNWLLEQEEDTEIDYRRRDQRGKELCLAVAQEFLQRHSDADEAIQILNERLQAIVESGVAPAPYTFLGNLSELNPSYAAKICEALIEMPDSTLAQYFYSLLYGVRSANADLSVTIARLAVDTGNKTLCKALAGSYLDLEFTQKFLCHADLGVRQAAISSLHALKSSEPRLAIAVALTVAIGDSTELASELCQVFDTEYGVSPDALTDEELGTLLAKLEPITNIDKYHISQFLAYASKRLPRSVIQLLLNRIDRDEKDYNRNYKPLPDITFQGLDGLAESDEYEDILRDIRKQALNSTYAAHFWLPKLFEEASMGFNPASLKLLNEWINSGNTEKIQAASLLLRETPSAFVFMQVEFVTNLLEQAAALGDDCYRIVSSDLSGSATSGSRSQTKGQPASEDVTLQEQSSALAARFLVRSPSNRFYNSLAKYAKASIQEQLALDEESLD